MYHQCYADSMGGNMYVDDLLETMAEPATMNILIEMENPNPAIPNSVLMYRRGNFKYEFPQVPIPANNHIYITPDQCACRMAVVSMRVWGLGHTLQPYMNLEGAVNLRNLARLWKRADVEAWAETQIASLSQP